MRIFSYDFETTPYPEVDFTTVLRPLAASPDRVERAIWRKLLDVISHLTQGGRTPEVFAMVMGTAIDLEATLSRGVKSTDLSKVRVEVDWYDYGPVHEGLPRMHYRIKCYDAAGKLRAETRREESAEAAARIRSEFGDL